MHANPHGGDAQAVALSLGFENTPEIKCDFSVNVNHLGPPKKIQKLVREQSHLITHYPQVYSDQATESLARAHGIQKESLIIGNGSTEIFYWIVQALHPESVGWIDPCYAGYREVCQCAGIKGESIAIVSPNQNFKVTMKYLEMVNTKMFFLTNPNNPTGTILSSDNILSLALDKPHCLIVVDESFIDFIEEIETETDTYSLIGKSIPKNLIIVKSLTKFFCIPGLRLGMAYAHPDTLETISQVRLPWTVNSLAQIAATVLYDDRDYILQSRKETTWLRDEFTQKLSQCKDVKVYPGSANFLLMQLPKQLTADFLQEQLLKRGILIRSCSNFSGLGHRFCRLAVRPKQEIDYFITAFKQIMAKSNSNALT